MTTPRIEPKISWGTILQILVIIVAITAGWVDNRSRTERVAERLDAHILNHKFVSTEVQEVKDRTDEEFRNEMRMRLQNIERRLENIGR